MPVFVPARLQKHLLEIGPEGAAWLSSLPECIAALEQAWGIRASTAFDHPGVASWVAPVECEDGSGAVLKLGFPSDEARWEAEALRWLAGRGAVRLWRVSEDGFALLIERCLPGTNLWALEEAEADAVAAALLPRLWREPEPTGPFLTVTGLVAQWLSSLAQTATGRFGPERVAHALALGESLAASQPRRVLLHGDFHPANVLAAQREPWLVIDPKPLIGDPAYDLAQWLSNRYDAARASADPVAAFRRQITRFATALTLDPARIAGWAVVKSVGWDWGPEVFDLFQQVAETYPGFVK